MNDIGERIRQIRQRSQGHAEIWNCSLDEFINKAAPVLVAHSARNKLHKKVVKLAAQFLRIKFDRKELKGEIDYEVSKAIEEALIYYVNCAGEEV